MAVSLLIAAPVRAQVRTVHAQLWHCSANRVAVNLDEISTTNGISEPVNAESVDALERRLLLARLDCRFRQLSGERRRRSEDGTELLSEVADLPDVDRDVRVLHMGFSASDARSREDAGKFTYIGR